MQQKKIIIFIVILFVLSSAYLFFINDRHLNAGKNWWAVYFEDPRGESPNFIIENNTDKTEFEYLVVKGNIVLKAETVEILKGGTKNISVEASNLKNKRITVEVYVDEEKREIYKNY